MHIDVFWLLRHSPVMPRKLRVEYEGAIYHLINRGDRREDIFLGDNDRELFLETLAQTCQKTEWQVHAYCLMRNHFHLVIETPKANLKAGMQWLLGTYTARFNRRHKLCGHLFSGRYKSLVVDGSGSGYLKTVCDYVHLNPVRAKLLESEQPLREYGWSSYPEYLKRPGKRPAWLRVDRLLGEWGIREDNAAGRRQFQQAMQQRQAPQQESQTERWQKLRRGWCWGAEGFRQQMLERIAEKRGDQHHGEELRESEQQKAERLVRQLLKKRGWTESDLATRRKGDRTKVRLATHLRSETTMSWKWIAERLSMGHWRSAATCVRSAKARFDA
ncbi:MAG: transposase [Limisphaerales bacterium]